MTQRSPPDDVWIQAHHPRLLRGAWLLLGNRDEAEELVQETLIQAIEGWHRFDGRSSEGTWLYSIMLRTHRRRLRSLARAARRLARWWQTVGEHRTSDDPATVAQEKQWRDSLWSEVAELPTGQQHALVMRYAEGMSFAEIGVSLGCPESTARTRVHYALAALRSSMTKQPLPPINIQSEKLTPCPIPLFMPSNENDS
jgi:RNA polymerase sigma-70 factor, ECF subfamily